MNLPGNLSKSSLLALLIFWIIIGSKEFDIDMIPFIMLSYIPIFICVLVVYLCSIGPIFWSAKSANFSNAQIFKLCFPYYTCIAFGLCSYGIIASDFDLYFSAFCISAYITTNQSWIWFAKEKPNTPEISKALKVNEHDQLRTIETIKK